jgi:hypothetical protein
MPSSPRLRVVVDLLRHQGGGRVAERRAPAVGEDHVRAREREQLLVRAPVTAHVVEERRHLDLPARRPPCRSYALLLIAGHVQQRRAAADAAELLDVAAGVEPGDVERVTEAALFGHAACPQTSLMISGMVRVATR